MNRKLVKIAALPASIVLATTLTSCGADNEDTSSEETSSSSASDAGSDDAASSSELSGTLVGAGASSQKAAVTAWANGFQGKNPDTTVNYDSVGSGAGRKQFIAGASDFGGSDAYFAEEQLAEAQERCGGELIELPLYIAPIAIAFNLEGIDELQLSPETLAMIFDGKIDKWNNDKIKADNPDTELPDVAVTPVHRSDESGTTENFVEYLSVTAKDAWPHEVSGDWPVQGGEAAKGTQGVVSTVAQTNGAIGYADAGQIGDLKAAKIKVGEEFVAYSPEAAAKIVDASEKVSGRGEHDHAMDLKRDTTEAGTYPVVLVSYTLACTTYDDQETVDLVKNWIEYVASEDGQAESAREAGSAPISDTTRENAMKAAEAITTK